MSAVSACMPLCQKRASDPTIDGCEPPCDCWELNSDPLEEQPVLLTAEPFLQPLFWFSETESHYVALAVLELTMQTRLASKSTEICLPVLPRAGIKDVRHHTWPLAL